MKNNFKLIIGVIIGVVLSCGIGVAANILSGDQIEFSPNSSGWQADNVQDALNDLYSTRVPNHYSTNETIVGEWIDGKPIYQRTWDLGSDKTIAFNSTFSATGGTWYNTGIPGDEMDTIISCSCIGSDVPQTQVLATKSTGNSGQVGINNASTRSIKIRYVTIQYTKLADQGNN